MYQPTRHTARLSVAWLALSLALLLPTLSEAGPYETFVDQPESPEPGTLQVSREGFDSQGRIALTLRAVSNGTSGWIAGTLVISNASVDEVETSRRALDDSAAALGLPNWYTDLYRRGMEGQALTAPTDGTTDALRFVKGGNSLSFGFHLDGNDSDELRIYIDPGTNPGEAEIQIVVSSDQPTEGWLQSDAADILVGSISQDRAPDDGRYVSPRQARVRLLHEDIDIVPLIATGGRVTVGEVTSFEMAIESCGEGVDYDQDNPIDRHGNVPVGCTQRLDNLAVHVEPFISSSGVVLPNSAIRILMPASLDRGGEGVMRVTIRPPESMATAGRLRGNLILFDDNDGNGLFNIGDTFDFVVVDIEIEGTPGYEPPIYQSPGTIGEAVGFPSDELEGRPIEVDPRTGEGLTPEQDAGQRLQGGLCLCQTTRKTSDLPILPVLFGLILLGVWWQRRRGLVAVATIILATVPATSAQGQDIDLSRLELTGPGGDRLAVTDFGRTLEHLEFNLGLVMTYGHDPLIAVSRDSGAKKSSVVEHRLDAVLSGSLGLFDWVEVGVAVPAVLYQEGADNLANITPGDPQAGLRIKLYPADETGLRLALVGAVAFPLQREGGFAGSGGVRGDTELIAGWSWGLVELALNAGLRFQADSALENIHQQDELRMASALAVHPADGWTTALEIRAATALQDPFSGSDAAEAFVSARWHDEIGRFVTAYGGLSVLQGYGVPSFSAGLGVGYSPVLGTGASETVEAPDLIDTDRDGYLDPDDDCPLEPEDFDAFQDEDGCPDDDNDGDGFPDRVDGAPNLPEDLDEWEDDDGIPDPDNDFDGVLDGDDQCPLEPEDRDGYMDSDGCNDRDNDGDGLEDWEDQCPNEAGPEYTGGCQR